MRFSRSDVRDHIVSSKIDHVPPQWRWQAMQQQRCLEIDFREIFWVVRFSTFATLPVLRLACFLCGMAVWVFVAP